MMEGAYYQQKRTSPTALAIVVLMHGAALTALAMAKGEAIRDAIAHTKVFNVKPDEPPPPEPVKPIEKAATPPATVITHVPPVVEMPPQPVFVQTLPLPPVQRIVIEQPPIAPPRVDPPAPPAARKVEPARARANLASYVSDADYPGAAVRNEEQGTTRFRLGVGPDGKVTDCTVTASSGSSALDSTTCKLMRQRAKFTPARDSDGKLTSDSVTSAIRWVLPE
jgi:periplasmic protein TonB